MPRADNAQKKTSIRVPAGIPRTMMKEYVNRCLSAVPPAVVALARSDYGSIRIFGHRLRGTGGAYGIPELTEIGLAIETAALGKNLIELRYHMVALESCLIGLVTTLSGCDLPEPVPNPGAATSNTGQGTRGNHKLVQPILLVDDDESYRAILGHHLKAVGYQVLDAQDGGQACRIASQISPGLVILDIVMPNMEGLETISRLRQAGVCASIVAISGAGKAYEYLRLAGRLGADAVFEKILPISELLKLVERFAGNPSQPAVGESGTISALNKDESTKPEVLSLHWRLPNVRTRPQF